jgi:hypothetical protein
MFRIMRLDNDFVADIPCVGRSWMNPVQRWLLDLVCRLVGHNIWRVMGSIRTLPGESLPLRASYCRRCFKGGYVKGDWC